MDELIAWLKLETLLVYGGKVPYNYGKIKVKYYKNEVVERERKK